MFIKLGNDLININNISKVSYTPSYETGKGKSKEIFPSMMFIYFLNDDSCEEYNGAEADIIWKALSSKYSDDFRI